MFQQMQIQVPIANLPVNLVLLNNETLAFIRVNNFKAIFDNPENPSGTSAVFYEDKFLIDNVDYNYNQTYPYKTMPSMLLWLQQQRLIL